MIICLDSGGDDDDDADDKLTFTGIFPNRKLYF